MGNTNTAPGKSIFRAVNVLKCIGQGATSITDIAETCDLSKATVHRLLNALAETHLVQHDPSNHQYLLGTLFIRFLSTPQVTHEYLIRCAYGEMKRLAELTKDTIHLDIMSGMYNIVLKTIASRYTLRIVEDIGENEYLHAGATAKVLLSQLNDTDLKIAVKNMEFKPFTESTIIHSDELMVQIKRIKEQGYAVSFGERVTGTVSISTSINSYVVPAALSVLGPQDRIRPRINEILNEMKKSSAIVSQNVQESLEINNEKSS